jgi:hypothetical protein
VLLRLPERLSVDLDPVLLGIDPRGKRVDRLAIHGDGSLENELLALATGGDARLGEDLLKPIPAFLLPVGRD